MAATVAIIGKGSTFSTCATLGGSYVAIAEITGIDHPRLTSPTVEATNFDSPNSYEEGIAGVWVKVEPLKVTLHYLKAQTTTLIALVGIGYFYKVTKPDGSTWTGPGVLSDFGGATITPKGIVEQDATITPTGKWTWAPAA